MKRYVQKATSIVLVVSMIGLALTGCDTSEEQKITKKSNVSKAEANVEQLLTSKVGEGNDTDKTETVFMEMDADGKIINTTVSAKLKVSGKDNIKDASILNDITNLSGDETFAKDGDSLIWENKGKDISYQGTTTSQAPLGIDITYYLDGKKMSAKDMAGKSGKVKIVYRYTNSTEQNGDFVPFIALSGMVLDDSFSNVSVDNGKISQYDDANIVVGYGAPGVKSYLLDHIKNADKYIGDINIPDCFEVTADVEDFSMGMTLTVATSSLGEFDLDESLDLSDMNKQMKELQDGADQLQDGASDLKDGATEIESAVKAINSGAKELESGIKSADGGAQEIESAASALDEGATQIKDGAKTLNDGAGTLYEGVSTAKKAFEDTKTKSGKVKSKGLRTGSKELADGIKSANKGVQELVGTLTSTPAMIQKQIDGIIEQVKAATGGLIASEKALNTTVEGINKAVASGMELNTVLAANGLNATAYLSLSQAYYSIQTLESVKSTFQSQISASTADVNTLLNGMNSLETGSSQLNTGITQLYTGMKKLETGALDISIGTGTLWAGAKTLKSGTSQLAEGSKALADGTGKLSDGAGTLTDGTSKLADGAYILSEGTKQLEDGAIKLNKEGISKITEIFGKDAEDAIDVIEDLLNSGKEYKSFSGIGKDMSGSVKFIYKTEEIKSE